MSYKKNCLAIILSAFFGLSACGENSSSASAEADEETSVECDSKASTCEQAVDEAESSSSIVNKENAKSSSCSSNDTSNAGRKKGELKSSSSKAKSSSSAKETKDVDKSKNNAKSSSSGKNSDDTNNENDEVKSSSSAKASSSSTSSESNAQEDIASSSSSESSDTGNEGGDAESSSSVEIDPEAFNGADLEQCSGKSNGTKVNIGGIPFICMNGQMTPDEEGINELIGNKYKGCEDSKLEDDIWIFSSSPMGSWNTEKIKWITETSYEYTTFPVPPDQMEAYEELADLGLGPDKQTIEGANREEVYAKYCGK